MSPRVFRHACGRRVEQRLCAVICPVSVNFGIHDSFAHFRPCIANIAGPSVGCKRRRTSRAVVTSLKMDAKSVAEGLQLLVLGTDTGCMCASLFSIYIFLVGLFAYAGLRLGGKRTALLGVSLALINVIGFCIPLAALMYTAGVYHTNISWQGNRI